MVTAPWKPQSTRGQDSFPSIQGLPGRNSQAYIHWFLPLPGIYKGPGHVVQTTQSQEQFVKPLGQPGEQHRCGLNAHNRVD